MRLATVFYVAFLATTSAVLAADEWPKVIEFEQGTLTVYQPQADSYEGSLLEGRSAVSWSKGEGEAPLFGAVWLSMRVEVDREARMVYVRELEVPQVRFPDLDEQEQGQLIEYLERELPKWDLPLELDRLVADLELLGDATTPGLRHEPPRILYSAEPAVLVRIDGSPRLETVTSPDGDKFERVVNTPFLIARPDATGPFYLSAGGTVWYTAEKPEGPWTAARDVPSKMQQLVDPGESTDEPGSTEETPPKIIVATEPAELIVSDGPPKWAPVEGVPELLYMTNTDSEVLLEISSQAYYTLLSGRWYRGRQVQSEWLVEHVPNDQLPVAFTDIPEGSAVGDVLSQVAGTVQAREAVLDNAIPQTAAVRRDDVSFSVDYDGTPRFEPVKDADKGLQSAANTSKSVFKLGNRYYACDEGVWYESSSPTGPWQVCVTVPDAIYSVPPSNPHHNVTYVHVYDVTPQVVYVGYTPGYVGSYWYRGCVVYGTGWHYHPWYGPHYYPRPWTWGLRVHYNPWYGWSFGIAFSNGPFTFSFSRGWWGGGYYGGWWGPGGYRPYPRPYIRAGYTKININRNININMGNRLAARPSTLPARAGNIYDRADNRNRLAERPATRDRRQPGVARDRANDVFTDRNGNVYRKDRDGGWQQRDRGQWRPAEGLDRQPAQRPSLPSGPSQPSTRPARPSTQPARPSPRPTQPSVRPSPRPTQPSVQPSPRPSTRPSPRPTQPSVRSSGPRMGRSPTAATRPSLERDSRARQRGSARSQGFSRPAPRTGGRRPR